MHEQVDSFGALPYFAGGSHVAPRPILTLALTITLALAVPLNITLTP